LRLQDVASTKKAQLQAARTIEKLQDEVAKGEHEWKQHATKIIEELRQENQHVQRLHELAQKRCHKWKTRCLELAERETKRRMDEQRAQTAGPTMSGDLLTLLRSQSQPSLGARGGEGGEGGGNQSPTATRNYDEMWSARFTSTTKKLSARQPAPSDTVSDAVPTPQRSTVATLDLGPRATTAYVPPWGFVETVIIH
jgi:hypothetical protein